MSDEDLTDEIRRHIAREAAKGLQPRHITFPSQDAGVRECRICGVGIGAEQFSVMFYGRELPREKVYIFCAAMVCSRCMEDGSRHDEFIERMELRYQALKAREEP